MNKEFFINNRKKLIETIEDNSVVILFAGDAPYKSADYKYSFVPNRNFYYVTGFPRENAIYMVAKKGEKVLENIFIERKDPMVERWLGPRLSVDEAKELTGIENIRYIDEFNSEFERYPERFEIDNILLDLERQEYGKRSTISEDFANEVIRKYPYLRIKNVFNEIGDLRLVKTEEEIDLLKKAIAITKEAVENVMKHAKADMMEYELEAFFDYTLKKHGVKFTSFNTIMGSGHNGTVLHYESNNCKAEDGSLVLLDCGAQWKFYNGDVTRTFPVNGKFTERQKAVYNAVLRAQKAIEAAVKAGAKWSDINELSKKELAKGCMELGLIKEESEVIKYYFHTFGHSLGLDTHDVGRADELKPGMVFTNEPGLYIPEEGIGVRIEDDLLVTEDGCINLSKDIIKEVDEIEAFMAKVNK
ncbi:aminopeptidase P Metallo peptidase. MEROPS family M24B [Clostridium collagenovorans DSM 3089]|uniref:Xaa-Pro aminopeptidase n=1 Tax=Clostridium collagenovorans DSM 3089 TaxID=1121306 RepID=A0A1M5SLT1_9CLOT|nr:aminopeptidase P family protein [Clostridium collagenovorans]SHH39509.1 aminopeptidase P Metallo peptidase. MEROPS family M24B [Clostridium collagenovorans DSM 3089]